MARYLAGIGAVLYALTVLIGTESVCAAELPRGRPEELGFSVSRLKYLDQYYQDEVRRGELAGIVILIARHGKVAHLSAIGFADLEKRQLMRPDTIFRLYSMTKPVTSVALMMLYQEGRFQLQDPISKYVPEFADLRVLHDPNGPLDDTVPATHVPTVQDVMRHTAGFTHGLNCNSFDAQYTKADVFGLDVSLSEMMGRLAKIPLRYQPGTRFAYSVGPDIQARLIEVLSGMPFDQFLERRLFQPLGMQDTGFWLRPEKASRLATVHWAKDGKLVPLDDVHGHPNGGVLVQPWSVNSYTADHKRKGGSFGLVSTAGDYWRFAQMMLSAGQLNGRRILSPQIAHFMVTDHLGNIPMGEIGQPSSGIGFGLGFAVMKNPAEAGYMNSEGSFFWWGIANTHFWIDPKEDMVVVAMTQHMEAPGADALWPQIRTLVYSALSE